MGKVYAATSVEKRVEKDDRDSGADPSTSRIIMWEKINLEADSLQELLSKIQEDYFYDGTYFSFYVDDEEGGITRVSFNQMEDNDSNPLDSEECNDRWDRGESVWLADYDFSIEVRVVSAVQASDLDALKDIQTEVYG